MLGGWAYPATLAATLALSLVLTPVALRVALGRRILDQPGGYKKQEQAVPYLGGVAIVVAFAVVIMAAAALGPPRGGVGELAAVLGVGVALSLLGLVDDLRGGLSPWLRLGFQGAAGVAMWLAGIRAGLFDAELLNFSVTVLWIVGITNAFNLLDNMDGLSAGVATIATGFFFFIAALNGQVLVASLAIALGGCAVGFLHSNFHPARIYMGDAGSLFLGFMLAVLGVKTGLEAPAGGAFLVPILVLGLPILDTTLVILCRLSNGRNPMTGGRDHVSHRLVSLGLSVPVAVSAIYAAAATLGGVAVVIQRASLVTASVLAGLLAALAASIGSALAGVPVYESQRGGGAQDQTIADGTGSKKGDDSARRSSSQMDRQGHLGR